MAPRTVEQNEHLREQRRTQLLEAAQRVFSRQGFHAAAVSDVAAEAGVSQGTVYHYFDSKEALLLAVFTQWETENLHDEIEHALLAEPTAAGKLTLIAHVAAERVASSLQLLEASVEFWSHIPRNAQIRKGFKRMFERMAADVASVIQQGIVAGEFRAVDAGVTARLLIATYDGLVLQWLADKKGIDWRACTQTLVTVTLQGLAK
jgi:TetR/AcrR family fatty acid metabolism transcriptional regulator